MIDVSSLSDEQLVKLVDNRWKESEELWSTIKALYKEAKRIWQNSPEWLQKIPTRRSKTRDNRIFQSIEHIISNLTGRPSKPNAIPANDTQEAGVISDNLQDFFLAKYRDLQIKKKMRKGLRYLFFSRLIVLKVFWNHDIDDFDTKAVDSRNVRFSPNANNMFESEFAIEEIEDTIPGLLELFPRKKEKILKIGGGGTEEEAYIENQKIKYQEAWIGDYVIYKLKGEILDKEPNPYWDWEGVLMTEGESDRLNKLHGKRRRVTSAKVKKFQEFRKRAKEAGRDYQLYLHNYLDKPTPPYIFGTIFDVEDKPIGETSLVEQANPLQIGVDKRKRQFDDNADMANTGWKVDTGLTNITKDNAQKIKADPRGIWWGKGVKAGVTRESGEALPAFLFNDMEHSIREIDNLFATQPTSRGERRQTETATGRAILREQSLQRLNELIDLMDSMHEQLYAYWFQMMKVRYNETHLIKPIGAPKANEVIELTQDDLQEGIEIKIIPGQVLPEDRLFKAERATEAFKAGLIDPITFFEANDWDNPMEQAKKTIMFQLNPFSIIDLEDDDIQRIQKANQLLGGGQGGDQQKAQEVAKLKKQAEDLIKSPEFKRLPPEEQRSEIQKIQKTIQNLTQAK